MRHVYLTLLLTIFCTFSFAGGRVTISGTVRCEKRAVSGVMVTDGDSTTVTDEKGRYTLSHNSNGRFVYISIPSGYTVGNQDGVPNFFISIEPRKRSYDFTLTRKTTDDTNHGFIAIADPQIWHRKEFARLQIAMDDIRESAASFNGIPFHGVGCGDIVSSDHSFYEQYNRVVATSGLQFFNCMGNHDMVNNGRSFETAQSKFEDMYGPTYYSYNVGKVHYVVLNDTFYIGRDYFYIGYLVERQMAWLERDLGQVKAGSTVVLYLHIPTSCEPKDRETFQFQGAGKTMSNHRGLYNILAPYNTHIISGHTHTTYNQQIKPNLYEHVTAAICGAWWQGELCTDGTPQGYGIYKVEGDNISWVYKSTGHPVQHQMTLYSGEHHPEFEGYIVANIWNSDPSWRVELYEDGMKVCDMERFEAYDPTARAMYSNTDKLDHKWISPSISDHYYRAPLSSGASKIEVVATDKFANTYRNTLK